MQSLMLWAQALRSGNYGDCRLVVEPTHWCYLKQQYREHERGEIVPVYNPLGVFCAVMGAEFLTTRTTIYICNSDISSSVSAYFRQVPKDEWAIVKSVCDAAEDTLAIASGDLRTDIKPFYMLADEIEIAVKRLEKKRKCSSKNSVQAVFPHTTIVQGLQAVV